jgi:hypothetical protein
MIKFIINITIGVSVLIAAISSARSEIIPLATPMGWVLRNLEPELTYEFPATGNKPQSVKLDFNTITTAGHRAYSLSVSTQIVANDGWVYVLLQQVVRMIWRSQSVGG